MHSHLHRLDRVFTSNPVYFITTTTHDRRALLARQDVAEILISEWRGARERHGWGIGRYVIMPDHVHFFCARMPPDPRQPSKSLVELMQAWKQWTAKESFGRYRCALPSGRKNFLIMYCAATSRTRRNGAMCATTP